jgi:hypothetical protein
VFTVNVQSHVATQKAHTYTLKFEYTTKLMVTASYKKIADYTDVNKTSTDIKTRKRE